MDDPTRPGTAARSDIIARKGGWDMPKEIAVTEERLNLFVLCLYDPSDPDGEPQPVSDRFQPRSLKHARQVIAAYNVLAACNPTITTVLGLFPKFRADVLDRDPDVKPERRGKVAVAKHSL
jgi:hypothetical protein